MSLIDRFPPKSVKDRDDIGSNPTERARRGSGVRAAPVAAPGRVQVTFSTAPPASTQSLKAPRLRTSR